MSKMTRAATNAMVDCLISAMRSRPEDFEIGSVTMKDTKTGYEYWICQGLFSVGVHKPFNFRFGFINGYKFSVALKGLKAHQLIQKTCGEKADATA